MINWRRSGAILGLLASVLSGGLSTGQTAPSASVADATTADIRCVVVSMALMGSPAAQHDPALKGIATTVALYYVGRLDGRTPDLELEGRMLREAKTLTPDVVQSEGRSCGERLTLRGKALNKIGQDLVQMAKAVPPVPPQAPPPGK